MIKYFCDLCGKETNTNAYTDQEHIYINALQIDPYEIKELYLNVLDINIVCIDCRNDFKKIIKAYVYAKTHNKEFNYDKIPEKPKYEYPKYEGLVRKMSYIGYSSHDSEAVYVCPMCEEKYGSWRFFNMEESEKEEKDGKLVFTCKCGTKLYIPD